MASSFWASSITPKFSSIFLNKVFILLCDTLVFLNQLMANSKGSGCEIRFLGGSDPPASYFLYEFGLVDFLRIPVLSKKPCPMSSLSTYSFDSRYGSSFEMSLYLRRLSRIWYVICFGSPNIRWRLRTLVAVDPADLCSSQQCIPLLVLLGFGTYPSSTCPSVLPIRLLCSRQSRHWPIVLGTKP